MVRPPSPSRPAYGGCRQVAREECVKVPVVEVRQVPTSSCLPVSDVVCFNVLTPIKAWLCIITYSEGAFFGAFLIFCAFKAK